LPFKSFQVLFSSDKKFYQSLKKILGFYPTNISLYKKAFKHKSVVTENKNGIKDSNERMEYLGDAVFGAIVANFLFKKYLYKDEGFLSKMRSKMVSRNHLNKLAVKLGIDKLVEYQSDRFSKFKSVNGDAFEALIGAIYLDKGYKTTEDFVVHRLIKFHIDVDELENYDDDYKSKIINWAQKERKKLRFTIEEEIGNRHNKQYKVAVLIDDAVMGKGIGFSKKRAEQEAAEKACIDLKL